MYVITYLFFSVNPSFYCGGGLSPPRIYKSKGQIIFLHIPALFPGRLAFIDYINGLTFPLAFDWV